METRKRPKRTIPSLTNKKLKDITSNNESNEILATPSTSNVNVKLDKTFFQNKSCIDLAKCLLGQILCRRVDNCILKGIIVETESYLGSEDHASYSFGGRRTEVNEPMYMEAGTCFVRLTYGMYHCFNISSQEEGAAVLLRAIEPIEGIDKMCQLRRNHPKGPAKDKFDQRPFQLANGPSKLCIAFNVDKTLNKSNILTNPDFWIEKSSNVYTPLDVVESTRVGIGPSNPWANKLMRYYLKNFKSVSKTI